MNLLSALQAAYKWAVSLVSDAETIEATAESIEAKVTNDPILTAAAQTAETVVKDVLTEHGVSLDKLESAASGVLNALAKVQASVPTVKADVADVEGAVSAIVNAVPKTPVLTPTPPTPAATATA